MKALLLVALISCSFVSYATAANTSITAQNDKSEPAPKDRDERDGGQEEKDTREETYEGNERGGGSFDGGGYSGDGGGMMSELFLTVGGKVHPVTTNVTKEDRGDVIVYTTTVYEALSASETCVTTTVTVIDKKTEKVISSDSSDYCNQIEL